MLEELENCEETFQLNSDILRVLLTQKTNLSLQM